MQTLVKAREQKRAFIAMDKNLSHSWQENTRVDIANYLITILRGITEKDTINETNFGKVHKKKRNAAASGNLMKYRKFQKHGNTEIEPLGRM